MLRVPEASLACQTCCGLEFLVCVCCSPSAMGFNAEMPMPHRLCFAEVAEPCARANAFQVLKRSLEIP